MEFIDIGKDAETRFDTSNYEFERPLPKGKNKKVIGVKKDELDGKIMKEIVRLKAKVYIYLIYDGGEYRKRYKKVSHKIKT